MIAAYLTTWRAVGELDKDDPLGRQIVNAAYEFLVGQALPFDGMRVTTGRYDQTTGDPLDSIMLVTIDAPDATHAFLAAAPGVKPLSAFIGGSDPSLALMLPGKSIDTTTASKMADSVCQALQGAPLNLGGIEKNL